MNEVIIVSGVPRSGTSMMMRMLAAGGIPLVSDEHRAADEHNPHGYFEDQRVLRLARDSSWLDEARGSAVKIIYRLLPHLPAHLDYRVLFMQRSLLEVYDSQQSLLESRGDAAVSQERVATITALAQDLQRVHTWLTAQSNFQYLPVTYLDVVRDPQPWIAKITRFLERDLDAGSMAAAVDPALYRHRRL